MRLKLDRGSVALHCRCCGRIFKPRSARETVLALAGRVAVHIEVRHSAEFFGVTGEIEFCFRQLSGDDSRCSFHGNLREAEA